ncbi:hypothetical protein [Risungbinella massiliensis]|uniref:hypothetical protein n=1 Tax=Risungbinella massiliensis TaxID=1329796 RepID=UPI0005CB8D89|nr:hypothetical protein [Risungbinella massiliensis]
MQSYICPLCNGWEQNSNPCPKCGETLLDYGPVSYLYYDYSPYLPLEDMKRDNGLLDHANHQCPHQFYCTQCNYMGTYLVQEKSSSTL